MEKTPWYYRFNPCDIERHPRLAKLGDLVAKLDSGCPCCNGFRMLAMLGAGFLIGKVL